ncbi:MAG: hypothetical protein IPN29_13825 [Saprospiraceae bacterium]|nr:hypothetical protein [Saprospiraceae bacterium]
MFELTPGKIAISRQLIILITISPFIFSCEDCRFVECDSPTAYITFVDSLTSDNLMATDPSPSIKVESIQSNGAITPLPFHPTIEKQLYLSFNITQPMEVIVTYNALKPDTLQFLPFIIVKTAVVPVPTRILCWRKTVINNTGMTLF